MKPFCSLPAYDQTKDGQYRCVTNRLGAALLLFLALFFGLDLAAETICDSALARLDETTATVVGELCDSTAYLLSFMLPVFFFHIMTPSEQRQTMLLEPKLPRQLYLILPAGIAVIYTAAVFNAFLMRQLGLEEVSQTPYWANGMPVYEGVLLFIASVLVPAFCEEFLFRGAVMSALLPHGKTVAVLGSAFLFGLMHQNAGQFFYTTVAGIVLALLVLKGGSIWVAILLHMFNNLFSVVELILYRSFPFDIAMHIFSILEVLVIGGGIICLILLVARHDSDQTRSQTAEDEGDLRDTAVDELPCQPIRGFFTPLMTAFVVLCVAQMIFIIVYPYIF